MKNARITRVIASLSLLSLLDGCGPSETFADEQSALTCGHEASLLACCRQAFRPGKKRERCMADARHGRGICAHKRHDAGAVDAPGAGDGAADAAGADGPMDAANTDARDTNDSSVDAGPGESCQAASPNDVWMESDPPTFPAAMFATGANDVWMIGGYPTSVFRWDGVTWTSVLAAPSGETFSSIWASAPDDVWVAGTRVRRWNGVVWTDVTPASFVFWGNEALWGTGRDDVWLRTGPQPARLLEWNGSSWTDRSPPPSGIGEVFETSSLWGSAADDVWVVGYYAVNSKRTPSILHWNGLVWAQSPANTVLGAFAGIWGSAANDIWAGASEGMLHYDGTEWQVINGTPGVLGRLAFEERNAPAMWGSCANNVWAIASVASPQVSHFDGARWSTWFLAPSFQGGIGTITGAGPDNVWVGGSGGSPDAAPVPVLYRRFAGASPPVCGNGSIDQGEQCDPPDGQTCSVSCQKMWICGDGVLDPREQCDPPHASPPYPMCDATCRLVTNTPWANASCVYDGNACDDSLPCCNGEICSNGYCGGLVCRPSGVNCNGSVPCCGGLRCSSGTCACVPQGAACAGAETCCAGSCTSDGVCGVCAPLGGACNSSTPCCFGSVCSGGACVAPPASCTGAGAPCAQVAAGENHSCAIVNGGAKCWGWNGFGQLGNNSATDSSFAVQVQGLTSGVTAIAAGHEHTCAIVNGGAQCWGSNDHGQLGTSLVTGSSRVPVQVEGLTSGVTAIAAASLHTCAVVNGAAMCWGANFNAQLGNDSTIDSAVPVQVQGLTSGVSAIAVGSGQADQVDRSCAIVSGRALCWGRFLYGSMTDWSPVPVEVAGLTSGATAITVGAFHTCAIVNGGVQCWGATNIGIPGGDLTAHRTTPVPVAGLTSGVTAVASGRYITCAVVNGEARCLGSNGFGEIGNGTTNWATAPVTVQGLTSGVTALAIGTPGNMNHVCAMVNGKAECWGSNSAGELGNASRTPSSVPVMVTDVPPPPPPCGECVAGAERCDPTTFNPIFCVTGPDGCGHWGPTPPRNGCTGQARPGCEQTNSPFYCYFDAANCRVEARCPDGMICIAGTAGCVACPPGFPGCSATP